ncbi:hypothetical protein KVR01_010538 [Diaporthe batatas]|uniref:uncharacterized protein n=1 Tax=Diaporthe batatas TaxID=748121 RepID=UPI001D035FE7|nr:uncharacterized protein KVR01_010538 [Diaporthe batatas]KAG8159901.1 hypothetical protein KVR01_010538 [Diaporthe batatas]
MPPKYYPRPRVQKVIVKVNFGTRNGKFKIEKPKKPQPKWKRYNGRLVSNLPRRANRGGRGDLECFYHVEREDGEVLPPPQALWRQKFGDDQVARYVPDWDEESGNLTDALRRRSEDSDASRDFNGEYGLPYLYVYDEDAEPDALGDRYRRWRPLQILANGGYGVVITYVDDTRGFTAGDDISDDDKIVAKFNYIDGDLVEILASVIRDIGVLADLFSDSQGSQQSSASGPSTPAQATGLPTPPSTGGREAKRAVRRLMGRAELAGKIRKFNKEMARPSSPTPGSKARTARSGRRSSGGSLSSGYMHFERPRSDEALKIDSADTFRIENRILQLLDMTGSPHFPKLWKLADPPQDETLCTMDYIPGARTFDEEFDLVSNREVPIRLMWESILCLSKGLSVMAYGSEDPAPSHRVYGWNEIVNLDWSERNIFVRQDSPSHTCAHQTCFMIGDFGLCIIVPSSPKAKAAFRLEHLKLDWQKEAAERLPEAQIDTETPLRERIDDPIVGHFSYKSNIFSLAVVLQEKLGGMSDASSGET